MLGSSIKKSESDIANIVKKTHNFMRETKNYLKKIQSDIEKLHPDFSKEGKKDLLGMWVFSAKIWVSQGRNLENYSNFKSNFSFNNRSIIEIRDYFRTRGKASFNDLSQLINALSN